jgi:hypothetical protein
VKKFVETSAQMEARLLDIADGNPQTVSELLKMPEGKKFFRQLEEEARASERAEDPIGYGHFCDLGGK